MRRTRAEVRGVVTPIDSWREGMLGAPVCSRPDDGARRGPGQWQGELEDERCIQAQWLGAGRFPDSRCPGSGTTGGGRQRLVKLVTVVEAGARRGSMGHDTFEEAATGDLGQAGGDNLATLGISTLNSAQKRAKTAERPQKHRLGAKGEYKGLRPRVIGCWAGGQVRRWRAAAAQGHGIVGSPVDVTSRVGGHLRS